MTKAIYFDMDGTLNRFYEVEDWLPDLINGHTRPYREAKPMLDMRKLGTILNKLQKNGYHIGIVSWTSRGSSGEYNARIIKAKEAWLKKHIGAVHWDEIKIVPYGTPKAQVVRYPGGILFDDEAQNRDNWTGDAYKPEDILKKLFAL